MVTRIAREISHLAHGKALYSLAPVLGALSHKKREIVYRVLGEEYAGFDESVQRLLLAHQGREQDAGANDPPADQGRTGLHRPDVTPF